VSQPSVLSPQSPLPVAEAWMAVERCIVRSAELLAQHRIHLRRSHVGAWAGSHGGSRCSARAGGSEKDNAASSTSLSAAVKRPSC
jgi:hypothetical protein